MASGFVWYDLATTDMKAAARFYESAIGWRITDSGMPGMDYSMINAGEDMVGGMMPMPPTMAAAEMPPAWNGYIAAADVDESAKRAKALGGSVFQEAMDIPGIGRFAVIADPHGVPFIIFKGAGGETPVERPMGTPGHIAWRELGSGGNDEAFAFYSALFGWAKGQAFDVGPMGQYQLFNTGGDSIGGMMKARDGARPSWLYYFAVDALDAALARVTSGGGTIEQQAMEVPGGAWVAVCTDPQGARFGVLADKR